MSRFKLHPLALAIAAATLPASFTYAQTEDSAGAEEELIVTGFRRSLQNAIAIKQDETSIVEAISAEDIGKLPDSSIAESLARLPGLAGERVDGRTSGISVRGFSEDYVATTLNGRELLGIGDNRGVEFDLYPSEIISAAVVYKTPNSSLVTQGLGGIVDLRTIRPLEADRIISVNGNFEQNDLESANPDFDDTGYRLAFTYSDKFADDTLGVAISVATMESPSQEEQFRAWGYADAVVGGEDVKILGGHDSFVRSATLERDTIAGVVQWEPTEDISITFDALYIDFLDSKVFRGLEEGGPVWSNASYTADSVENGLVTSGTMNGFHSVIRNDGEEKQAELTTFGLNATFQLNDAWELAADLSVGESEKEVLNLESYSGVGRAGSAGQGDPVARSWVMTPQGAFYSAHPSIASPNYANPDNIRLAGPQAWGGGAALAFDDRSDGQDGFINRPSFDEELTSLRLQATGEVEFSIVNTLEVGINYSDRTKSKTNFGAYLTSPEYYTSATSNVIDGGDGPIPNVLGETDLSVFGLGSILAYDGAGLVNSGYYRQISAGLYQTDRLGDTYEVAEEVITAYVKADFETGVVTGDVGLQYVGTDQESTGFEAVTGGDGFVDATPLVDGDDYSHLLPSLNLNFNLTDEHIVRFAAARTLSRARIDDLRVSNSVAFDFDGGRRASDDPNFSSWSSSLGNAKLKPLLANQLDLTYEYYFSDDGYIAAAFFYKDLLNWHIDNPVLTNFYDEYFVPGYHDRDIPELISREGFTTSKEETGSGKVEGLELTASLPFHLLHESLDGAGIIVSGTFLDGAIEVGSTESAIPGLSEESYQITAYYENSGFELRISGRKRDAFLTEFPGLSLALTETTDLGSELWDAQIGYNFSESGIDALDGLTVTLQGQNLTDEETLSIDNGDPRQVNKWQHFGANYLLGVSYKF